MKEEDIYNSNLTNRFTGMKNKNVKDALSNRFQFSIQNTANDACRIAIIPAYFDTTSAVLVPKSNDNDSYVDIRKNNVNQLVAAGHLIDAVLSDSKTEFDKGEIICKPGNPTRSIENFLQYIKTNPTPLKGMTIMADNAKSFDTDMQITVVDPFNQNKVETVDISTFFDKYQFQDDRIDISFIDNELELSDVTLLAITIPAETKLNFIFRF